MIGWQGGGHIKELMMAVKMHMGQARNCMLC